MNNHNPKIAFYRLIQEYPGSPALGYDEPYTTGEYSKYPNFWMPIYKGTGTSHIKPAPIPAVPFTRNYDFLIVEGLTVHKSERKDSVKIGEEDYEFPFFINTRHLMESRSCIGITLNGVKVTSTLLNTIIRLIEDRMHVVC